MRTTIRIQDDLYRRVKARAAAGGRTVGEFVEDAVRDSLDGRLEQQTRVPALPIHGKVGGLMPGVDLSSHADVLDLMDEDTALDARR